jgi:hypothetical protein
MTNRKSAMFRAILGRRRPRGRDAGSDRHEWAALFAADDPALRKTCELMTQPGCERMDANASEAR